MAGKNEQYLTDLLKSLDGLMKSAEFKRLGFHYSRRTEHYWFLVHWQLSRDQIPDMVKFTINIGIHDIALAKIQGNDSNACPDIWECHLRQRAGFLLPERCDKWWSHRVDLPIPAFVIEEFSDLLTQVVIPYFAGFSSRESLLDIWKNGTSPGQTDYQRQHFIKLLESSSGNIGADSCS